MLCKMMHPAPANQAFAGAFFGTAEGSSSGRTAGSGPAYRGSNPCPSAISRVGPILRKEEKVMSLILQEIGIDVKK